MAWLLPRKTVVQKFAKLLIVFMSSKLISPQNRPVGDKPVIFIVDDDPDSLAETEGILRAQAFQTFAFTHPAAVLEFVSRLDIWLVILVTDYTMDSMNGFELTHELRRRVPDLRVVMLSGTLDGHTARQFPFRLEYFLSKPYEPAQLVEAVQDCLSSGAEGFV